MKVDREAKTFATKQRALSPSNTYQACEDKVRRMSLNPSYLCNMIARMGVNPNPTMGRAKRGLFCGKHIQFGNKISFAENKSRRTWKPNVQRKRLWSDILQKNIVFNVTTHALRNIKKFGGLDNLLLKKPNLIRDSERAMKLRDTLLKKLRKQEKIEGQQQQQQQQQQQVQN